MKFKFVGIMYLQYYIHVFLHGSLMRFLENNNKTSLYAYIMSSITASLSTCNVIIVYLLLLFFFVFFFLTVFDRDDRALQQHNNIVIFNTRTRTITV